MEVFEVWAVEGGVVEEEEVQPWKQKGKTKRAGEELIFREMRK